MSEDKPAEIFIVVAHDERTHRTRPSVWFTKQEDAIEWAVDNTFDLCEGGHYNEVFIEKSYEGGANFANMGVDEPLYFKYNKDTDKYEKGEYPSMYKGIAGWGMG
jgi:hypothetical protein